MKLNYRTRGMSEPKGKPRVYFSCRPADFDMAFPLISEDLLEHADCAVWYDEEPDAVPDRRELEEILEDMQLVVFAVTSGFLHEDNRAKDLELPLALERHIPVLPITLEDGLGYEFTNTCAKIQVVRKYEKDPTATPYADVLQTFLDSVLVGDELAQKVRDAFDAYIFLSYRKKDRRHAQRLMRMIHESEQYRDIAIWYDEYLVPGERFRDAIRDAFEKSSLFAMAVTPSLEEEGNFVMKVEYPMARNRKNRKNDIEIIPVEMYEEQDGEEGKDWRIDPANLVDHEEFEYRDIPDLQDEHRRPELDRRFLDALVRIAKKEKDGSAQHRFFIGLAYLYGIDVEVNRERGAALIRSAALTKGTTLFRDGDQTGAGAQESGGQKAPAPSFRAPDLTICMDAPEKLADMYWNGDGVERDLEEAIRWQEYLAALYRSAYELDHDPDAHRGHGTLHFKALRKLSDMQRETGKLPDAIGTAGRALQFCSLLEAEVGIREQEHDRALILNRLGSLYREVDDPDSARRCYEEALRIYERQAAEIGTRRARRDLSIVYERLGDLLRKEDDPDGADAYYVRAEDLRRQLRQEIGTASARRDYSAILTKRGDVRKAKKQYREAGGYYLQALQLDEVLSEESKTYPAMDDFAVSLAKVGDIHKALGRYEEAADFYAIACVIFRELEEKTGSRSYLDHYAGGSEKLASAKKKAGDRQAAGELYRRAVCLRERLYQMSRTAADAHALAVSCFNAALFFEDAALMKRALEIWVSLSALRPVYLKYRDRAEKLYRELMGEE